MNAGGVEPLAVLLKAPTDLLAQRAAILALRQLAMYGNAKVGGCLGPEGHDSEGGVGRRVVC